MTNSSIRVSVIIPAYNCKDRICAVLTSLIDQDFPASDYEIILVNDGSTDGWETLPLPAFNNLVIYNKVNQGAGLARMYGVEKAKGDVVIFHDADDIAYRHKISTLYNALTNSECIAAFADVNFTDDTQRTHGDNTLNTDIYATPLAHFCRSPYPLALAMNLATYKSHALTSFKGIEIFKAANDYHFQFQLSMKGPWVHAQTQTVEYFINEQGISSTNGPLKQVSYSLISLLTLMGSINADSKQCGDIKDRIANEGPNAMVTFLLEKEFKHFASASFATLKHTRLLLLPKHIWWAINRRFQK